MLDAVVLQCVEALRAAGLSAGAAYPAAPAPGGEAAVRVGVEGVSQTAAGLAGYLGAETDPETGVREVYGLRCELRLSLDVYAPPAGTENAALDCLRRFDAAAAALGSLPGLALRELSCGAPGPDRDTGEFRLTGSLRCAGLLRLAQDEDESEPVFADFLLRGRLGS